MSKFKIRKNVPMPKHVGKAGRPPIYPFAEMEVGDSFAATGKNPDNVRSYTHNCGKRYNMKFKTCIINGVCHVWRVE